MSFHYTLTFAIEVDEAPSLRDQAAIAYVMGASRDIPADWPAADFFDEVSNRVPLDAGLKEYFPQACELHLTRLSHSQSGEFEGFRLLIQIPGLALNECWPLQQFVTWLAQFSPMAGPVGYQYSPEMPDAAPTYYFVFNRGLHYADRSGAIRAFPSGEPLIPHPFVD